MRWLYLFIVFLLGVKAHMYWSEAREVELFDEGGRAIIEQQHDWIEKESRRQRDERDEEEGKYKI